MSLTDAEFSSALCPETWKVANGIVEITGQSEAVKNAQALEMKREEEMTDAFGNTVKVRGRACCQHDVLTASWRLLLPGTLYACASSIVAIFFKWPCDAALQIKQPKKTLSNKEKKKKERLKAARRKAGETVSDSEEEEW